MRRTAALSFTAAAALGLAGCAHEPASAPAAPAGMAWSLDQVEGEGAKLAYGQPQSDNVLVMLTCEPGSGAVRLSVSTQAPAQTLRLSSGGRSSRLKGEAAPAGFGDGLLLEGQTSARDPALTAFAQGKPLAIAAGTRWVQLPAAPGQGRRFVERCGGA